jgi:hypothetical protein
VLRPDAGARREARGQRLHPVGAAHLVHRAARGRAGGLRRPAHRRIEAVAPVHGSVSAARSSGRTPWSRSTG